MTHKVTQERQQREERERLEDARFEELLRSREPNVEERQAQMDKKAEHINTENKQTKIDELINLLKAKTAETDSLLKKMSESELISVCLKHS